MKGQGMGPVVQVLWEDWADRSLPLPAYQTAGAAGADLCANFPEAERAALNARQPHGRLVSADEVAGAVAYLASPRAGSTTGVALAVDGGMQELRLRPIE